MSDSAFLRLRDLPGGENIVAYIENGAQVSVYETATDKLGREWYHVLFEQATPHLFQDEALTQPYINYVRGYVYAPYVQFAPSHPAPVFTVDKTVITAGESVTLAWNAPGANALRINGKGVTGPANTLVSTPDQTIIFTFVATYDGEPVWTIPVTVTVNPAPVPPVPARSKIGVNIIGGDYNVIESWYAAGCRVFHITFNPDAAVQLKARHPDCIVTHRALFGGGGLPSKAHFEDKHGYCLDAANKIDGVFGVNENDQIGDGGQDGSQPDEIRKRAEWDAQAWQWCKDRGVPYVGGGFAMGTPNIVVPAIRQAMRQYYAPLFNAGMAFNQHTYSGNDHSGTPIKTRIFTDNWTSITWDGITANVRQTWWLEERPRFYVAFCGFDCSKSHFESDETGADGPGPFNDFGFSEADKSAWGVEYVKRQSEPMPDGKPYVLKASRLFADGDYNRWKAFADSIRPATIWKAVY